MIYKICENFEYERTYDYNKAPYFESHELFAKHKYDWVQIAESLLLGYMLPEKKNRDEMLSQMIEYMISLLEMSINSSSS